MKIYGRCQGCLSNHFFIRKRTFTEREKVVSQSLLCSACEKRIGNILKELK